MYWRIFISLIIIPFLAGCSGNHQKRNHKVSLNVSADASLAEHSREFRQSVYQVTDNVYSAVGYGLSNSIMIEGTDGLIIIDTMESVQSATKVFKAFREISTKPVKAIIYTHNHVDHIMGTSVFAAQDKPVIYAHEKLDFYVQRLLNKMRPIIGTRSMRMFGSYLEPKEVINCGIGPFLNIDKTTTSGYIPPSKTFSKTYETTVSGVKLQLIHAPGETNDQINVLLPEQNLLVCGDNYYKGFPNLYTIRGTPFRSLQQWYQSLDIIRNLNPSYLVPTHGRPVQGNKKINTLLTDYRDAIQFVHDQGIRGINQGMTPDELVSRITLPHQLASAPYLKEYYGKVSWSLRALFSGNLGWFSGDSADLQPLSRKETAKMILDISGGEQQLMDHIQHYARTKQFQKVLALTGHILRADPDNTQAKKFRTESLMALGSSEMNANARHYYLTEAIEIQTQKTATENTTATPEQLAMIPLDSFFSMLPVCLDANGCKDLTKTVVIEFTDTNERYTIQIRNQIADIQKNAVGNNPDIVVQATAPAFKALLAKIENPVSVLAGFDYEKGSALSFGLFMRRFKLPPQKVPFQTVD